MNCNYYFYDGLIQNNDILNRKHDETLYFKRNIIKKSKKIFI